MVGHISKVVPNEGLWVELPHPLKGYVDITDVRDCYVADPLSGYSTGSELRCNSRKIIIPQ